MANLPETPSYGAGIYQLETVDPVLGGGGGISNTQAQQLGNRTAYLKQHMDSAEADITSLLAALPLKAPLESPALTGTPTAPTASPGTNTTQIASTAFVTAAITAGQPDLSGYAPLASPALTGVPTAPTASAGTSTTQLATTAFVTAADALKAPLASPALTGTPTAPTAPAATNNTQIATTGYTTSAIATAVGTLNTALAGKMSKSGDQGTGNYGINTAPVVNTGLTIRETTTDAGFGIRCQSDMLLQVNPASAGNAVVLEIRDKLDNQRAKIGWTGTELMGWYNSAGVNKAQVDSNGNFIGGNLEVAGTWTPTIQGSATAGTASYSVRNGTYAIVGNLIFLQCYVTFSGANGTGDIMITGLPANNINLTNAYVFAPVFISSHLTDYVYQMFMNPGDTGVRMQNRNTTTTASYATVPVFSGGTISFSLVYRYR